MAGELMRRPETAPNVFTPTGRQAARWERQTTELALRTQMRALQAQAEGLVQTVKMQEVDHLAREAMTGQALLARYRNELAGPDPLLADELNYFVSMARLGKGQILADTITTFSRQG